MACKNKCDKEVTFEMLKAAFATRAEAYAQIFDVLREEFGVEKAVKLIATATRRLGESRGGQFAHLGPKNLSGLKEEFLAHIPCGSELFAPEVIKSDDEMLEIQFHNCPLKEHWMEAGRSDEDVEHLCEAAAAIDGGLFESAGFTFKGETWKKGKEGCCLLKVVPGPDAE